jgi:hypothetical protein
MRHRPLGVALLGLGVAVAATAVLGPLVLGVIRYRTSDTTLNQIMGGDVASLAVVAPFAVVAGVLVLRRHPAGPRGRAVPAAVSTGTGLAIRTGRGRTPGLTTRGRTALPAATR